MNAIGISVLTPILLIVLFGRRRWALLGMIAGALYLTQAQAVSVLGINLQAVRFVEAAGIIRVIFRREFSISRLNGIDRMFLLLYVYTISIFMLRSGEGAMNEFGRAVDAIFAYIAFRGLLPNLEEIKWLLLRGLFLLLIPYTALVMYETLTSRQPFQSAMGLGNGAGPDGQTAVAWLREGRARAFGSFRNPSVLGSLGASFLPLYFGLWLDRRNRRRAAVGIACCLAIVWAANSGGPVGCVVVCCAGWMLWRARDKMRLVRRSLATLVVLAALLMKAPVWYLLAKGGSLTGGDAWHRSRLLDAAFQDFGRWWLMGMPLSLTGNWFTYVLGGAADITNNFLLFGITGGVGSIILLIVLLKRSFSKIGKVTAAAANSTESGAKEFAFLCWGAGVMLAVHVANWFGIPYFDQFQVIWLLQLALISELSGLIGYYAAQKGPVAPNHPYRTRVGSRVPLRVAHQSLGGPNSLVAGVPRSARSWPVMKKTVAMQGYVRGSAE